MQKISRKQTLRILSGIALGATPALSQTPKPFTKTLACPKGDCSILEGAPQTAGMRSGFVRLKPGATVGWHTTGHHEETLVILHGAGAALIDGQPELVFVAPASAYIPPETRHNVKNTGTEPLEYVYVVAPTR
jgi:mannose-6-phosphate isomerase-like protein (cupin superfamily)